MAQSLVSFVERQAGESLRAIAEYDNADIELLYLRNDLHQREISDRVETIHDNITWVWNPKEDEKVISKLGEKRATVQVREDAVIIHLLAERKQGYLIGLEPDAARNLTTFLGECLTHVE